MLRNRLTIWVLATVFIVAPLAHADNGGGSINNVAPTTETFAGLGATRNINTADVLSGTVKDRNLERDLTSLQISTVTDTTGTTFTSTYTITPTDRSNTTAGSFRTASTGPGQWRVWNPVANDGLLSFEFTYTYTAAGIYKLRLAAKDEGSFVSTLANTPDLTVEVVAPFTTLGIVDGAGDIVAGNWGGWAALPGDKNVTTVNYLAIQNTGSNPTQAITINFASTSFAGVAESAFSIAIDENIQFACAEASEGVLPSTLTYTFGSTSATGSVSVAFTEVQKILYCQYKIVAIPDLIYDQAYQDSFTVA